MSYYPLLTVPNGFPIHQRLSNNRQHVNYASVSLVFVVGGVSSIFHSCYPVERIQRYNCTTRRASAVFP